MYTCINILPCISELIVHRIRVSKERSGYCKKVVQIVINHMIDTPFQVTLNVFQ